MKKIFVVEFGGTPSRAELCLLMNCAAGLYPDMEFIIYPLDKDINSPNYINSRALCSNYRVLNHLSSNSEFASSAVTRKEFLFDEFLDSAGIGKKEETILNLVSDNGSLGRKGQMLLDICFERDEQSQVVQNGYYGRADIGAVTSRFLIHKQVYNTMGLVSDINKALSEGGDGVAVIILCSSFGGTGASLGVNFGEYLAKKYQGQRQKLKLHCIHIQPYFSFPDPTDTDPWKINSRVFYAKSASVITAYGNKKNFIRNITQDEIDNPMNQTMTESYIFDSFYYIGQEVLDPVSDTNAAKDKQENRLHMIDMLVGMAIEDAVNKDLEAGPQIFSYLYSGTGTETLTWSHMKNPIQFMQKHISFARFSAFILQVLKPMLDLENESYVSEALIFHIYGPEGWFGKKANRARVIQETDTEFRECLIKVIDFCRNYLTYWRQIELTTTYGQQNAKITCFFNQKEISRVLEPVSCLKTGKKHLVLDNLTKAEGIHGNGLTGSVIYNKLNSSPSLKMAAGGGKRGADAASMLLAEIYKQCELSINE